MSVSKRPVIGCTTYRKTVTQDPPIEMLGAMVSYLDAIIAGGGIPMLIPVNLDEEALQEALSRVDGVVMPGGGDIDPQQYKGDATHTLLRDVNEERDRADFKVIRQVVADDKPLLAICRGHQVFNVALGGSLWEDIQSQNPEAMRHDYYRALPRHYLAHEVTLDPASKLAHYLGRTTTPVNSLHHQGIKTLAPGLKATATSADGLVEAIELPEHRFAIGVQWHPENLVQNDPAMLNLFRGLVDMAQKSGPRNGRSH